MGDQSSYDASKSPHPGFYLCLAWMVTGTVLSRTLDSQQLGAERLFLEVVCVFVLVRLLLQSPNPQRTNAVEVGFWTPQQSRGSSRAETRGESTESPVLILFCPYFSPYLVGFRNPTFAVFEFFGFRGSVVAPEQHNCVGIYDLYFCSSMQVSFGVWASTMPVSGAKSHPKTAPLDVLQC